jgi:hypothetical protein
MQTLLSIPGSVPLCDVIRALQPLNLAVGPHLTRGEPLRLVLRPDLSSPQTRIRRAARRDCAGVIR